MALPSLPSQGQDPWYGTRTTWDNAVKAELEGRLSEDQLNATISESVARLYVDDFGADEDWSAALVLAVAAAAGTGAVVADRGKNYVSRTAAVITDTPVICEFTGKVTRSAESPNSPVLTVIHGNSTPQPVTSLVNMDFTWPSSETTPATRVTVASTAGWAAGDFAVIVADDSIVGANPSRAQREGERVQILAVEPGYLWTARPLRVSLTTNIRIARMVNLPVDIKGLSVEDEAGSPANRAAPGVIIRGAVSPRVELASGADLQATFLTLQGCFHPAVEGLEASRLRTDSSNNAVGYGLRFDSCVDGTVTGLSGSFLRHAFTTGAGESTPAGSTALWRFGSNIGNQISGTGFETGHSGFDVHEEARYTLFKNTHVAWNHREPEGTLFAYTLRGLKNTLHSPTSIGPAGVRATAYPGGGDFVIHDGSHEVPAAYTEATWLDFNFFGARGTGPTYTQTPISMSGSFKAEVLTNPIDEGTSRAVPLSIFQYADVYIPFLRVDASFRATENVLFSVLYSQVRVGELVIDMRGSTGDTRIFRLEDGTSSVRVEHLTVIAGGADYKFADLRAFTGGVAIATLLSTDTIPGGTQRGFVSGGLAGSAWLGRVEVNGASLDAGVDSRGDGNVTVSSFGGGVQLYTAPLTANRTLTLPTTRRPPGDRVRVVRAATATGAFSVNIGSDSLASAGSWAEYFWSGSAWLLVGKGLLS